MDLRTVNRTIARAGSMRAIGVIGLACAALAVGAPAASAAAGTRAAGAGPTLTFYFGLKRPERSAIAAFLRVQQPGARTYRRFETEAEISRRFGATPATRSAFLAGIRRLGLRASVDRSGVFARVFGTQAQLQRAFKVTIVRQGDESAWSWSAKGPLTLPAAIKPLVRDVLPITELAAGTTATSTRASTPSLYAPLTTQSTAPRNEGAWTRGCAAARKLGGYAYSQIRGAYGLAQVGFGRGGSVAILNDGEQVDRPDVSSLADCFHYPADRVRSLRTEGQTSRFPPASVEPPIDLALVRGIAPQASVLQTAVWDSPSLWFLGPAKLLGLRRLPDALSISYGYCDWQAVATPMLRAGSRLLNAMFVRLGLAGVGVFGAAGDAGSSCNGIPQPGTAWPANSPYATSVGGSRLVLDRANHRVDEVVWNDQRWLTPAGGGGVTGGGVTRFYRRPAYQRAIRVAGDRRATPDIVASASRLPGVPIVANGGWYLGQGTSAAAPLAAAAFTAISARLQAHGQPPLGPVNGLLYWLYRHHRGALYDIVSGNNKLDSAVKVPGHSAHRGYDLASGLARTEVNRVATLVPAPGH